MSILKLYNRFKITAILITIILANFWFLQNTQLGIVIGLLTIIYYGQKVGYKLFPESERLFQVLFGGFLWLLFNALIITIAFYLYQVTDLIFVGSLLISTVLIEIFCLNNIPWSKIEFKINFKAWLYSILYLIFIGGYFVILFKFRTSQAIPGPWTILPWQIFIVFIIATFFLIKTILTWKNALAVIFLMLYFFAISGVATIIYQLGYGFDPFLHLAGIKNILATGTLNPTPFYYIGEYSLVIFLHHLTQISLQTINILLLPLFFSIITPFVICFSLQKAFSFNIEKAQLSSLIIFLLPINLLINTTPHGFNVFLAILIIFLTLPKNYKFRSGILIFLSIISCLIHPLFGAPLLLFSGYSIFKQKLLRILILLASIFVVPIMFLVNSLINHQTISLQSNFSPSWDNLWNTVIENRLIMDFIYQYGFNYKIIYLILCLLAVLLLFKDKKIKQYRALIVYSIIFFFNYFLLKFFIALDFVAMKNATDFYNRIADLGFYFLLPVLTYLFYQMWQYKELAYRLVVFIFTIIFLSGSLYFSYPVKDDYKNSKDYNLSATDIKTVNTIHNKATGEYIVLANQMTAAAAIYEFGFSHYYNNLFYYSIPTMPGKDLNDFYEQMTFVFPSVAVAGKAMERAGVDQLYLVINDYWSNSKTVIESAKKTADSFQVIDEGKAYIFYYYR